MSPINRHTTMRGQPINMAALVAQNATRVALGNAGKNARGDLVTRNGAIIKTQEQLEAEQAAARAKNEQLQADIKSDNMLPSKGPSQQQPNTKSQLATDQYPSIQDLVEQGAIPPKRKIVEKDD